MTSTREYFDLLTKVEKQIAGIRNPTLTPNENSIFDRTYDLREKVNQLYEIAEQLTNYRNYEPTQPKIPVVGETGIFIIDGTPTVRRMFKVVDVYNNNSFIAEYNKRVPPLPSTEEFVLFEGTWKPKSLVTANRPLTELNRRHVLLGRDADNYLYSL